MYLFEYGEGPSIKLIIDETLSNDGIVVSSFYRGDADTNSCIYIRNNLNHRAKLSEFPGNCSTLILSHVQYLSETKRDSFDDFVKSSMTLCKVMEYATLIITGTSSKMKEHLLTEFGFEILLDNILNPHSNRYNYFLIKKL